MSGNAVFISVLVFHSDDYKLVIRIKSLLFFHGISLQNEKYRISPDSLCPCVCVFVLLAESQPAGGTL